MYRKGLAVLVISGVFVSMTTIGTPYHAMAAARKSSPERMVATPVHQLLSLFQPSKSAGRRAGDSSVYAAANLNQMHVNVLLARGTSLSSLDGGSASLKAFQQKTKAETASTRLHNLTPLGLIHSPHTSDQINIHTTVVHTEKVHTAAVRQGEIQKQQAHKAQVHKEQVHKAKARKTETTQQPSVQKASNTEHVSQNSSSVGMQAARIAMHYTGVPYKWGGSTPAGFDCSGLVQYVYAKLGISLPHSSFGMFHDGYHVPRQDLRPGDLLFFNTDGQGASHVGIYLGGSRFVSAAGSQVHISVLNSYWLAHYLGARRP